jgi:taurine--2-oxoglutarate transaminase
MTSTVSPDHLREVDHENVLHGWTIQDRWPSTVLSRAERSHVWDQDGNRYLDFTSQSWYANIGHGEPRVADAVARQVSTLATVCEAATEPKIELTEKLLSLLPDTYTRVFYGSNGSDAVEAALKAARLVTGRQNVVAFWNAYHGGGMAGTSVTGLEYLRSGIGEPVPGTMFIPPPYHYRSPFGGATQAETDERTVANLRDTLDRLGPHNVAAVIGEPFNATTGMVPGPEFWRGVRQACDDHHVLLIADEVVSGFGRTGRMFALETYGYEADIICLAKGLTSGYLPLSATVLSRRVDDAIRGRVFPHGLTYSGHPVCCAAALATIAVLEEDGLVARAAEIGRRLSAGLRELSGAHPCIGDIRSIGAFAAIELVRDPATREPFPAGTVWIEGGVPTADVSAQLAAWMRAQGVLVNSTRVPGIVKFCPPFTVTDDEVDLVLDRLDKVLGLLDAHVG